MAAKTPTQRLVFALYERHGVELTPAEAQGLLDDAGVVEPTDSSPNLLLAGLAALQRFAWQRWERSKRDGAPGRSADLDIVLACLELQLRLLRHK